jgi:predicted kinase
MNGVLLLNGAFGVGKSTVARELAAVIPRARVFDPERIGWWLRRLPAWFPGSAAALCDYQDSVLWRRMTVRGTARNARQA